MERRGAIITMTRRTFNSALLALVMAAVCAPDRLSRGAARAHAASSAPSGDAGDSSALSPEERMRRRFPQPTRVGFLIGLPVVDWSDNTLGHVQRVVRSADGRIQLIVRYGGWFGRIGWWQRPVAVPIEAVALLGRHVAVLDITVEELRRAPDWRMSGESREIDPAETIQVAITRR
jgi:PRC-barrel domain